MVTRYWWSRKGRFSWDVFAWIKSATIRRTWKKFPAGATRVCRWYSLQLGNPLRATSRKINETHTTFRRERVRQSRPRPRPACEPQAFTGVRVRFLDGARIDLYRSRFIAGSPPEFCYRRLSPARGRDHLARRAVQTRRSPLLP